MIGRPIRAGGNSGLLISSDVKVIFSELIPLRSQTISS